MDYGARVGRLQRAHPRGRRAERAPSHRRKYDKESAGPGGLGSLERRRSACRSGAPRFRLRTKHGKEKGEPCKGCRGNKGAGGCSRESFAMVKKASKLVRRLQALQEAPRQADVPKADTEDIGGGVMVEKTVISRLHAHCQGLPTKFARSLLRNVFTDEELRQKSLYGKGTNAHKEGPAKDGLDPVRLNAVLGYTCGRFPAATLLQLKNSLSSMLSREIK
ncbi:uncharacterized protein LOC144110277 isoform X2 [Amblyomma americanum]